MVFPILGGNSAVAGYSIDNSLRFNSSDTPNLARTPSASNRDLFTISLWAKRSNLNTGARQVLFGVGNPATTSQVGFEIRFDNSVGDGKLRIGDYVAGVTDYVYLVTDAIFRDVSAWYHIVYVYDSAQATNTDRTKLYVNGTQITSFSSPTYPNQNQDSAVNSATQHTIGNQDGNGYEYNGYMAEMHLVDGQALSPTNFGEFDEDSGIWKPIQYTGTYGTNGFYLDFENSGSLGADQSGNGNNFTPTNLASTDQTTDTPTNNFATINALQKTSGSQLLSEGNLEHITTGNWMYLPANMASNSGKWYAECKLIDSTNTALGFIELESASDKTSLMNTNNTILGTTTGGWSILDFYSDIIKKNNNTNTTLVTGTNLASNDIIMFAMDLDNQKIWWGRNGTWFASGDPSTGSNPIYSNLISGKYYTFASCIESATVQWNFGNPPFAISSGNTDDNGYGNFEYAPPSGYLALCTQNLATALSPTIDDGSAYFQTLTYAGDSSARTLTNDGYSDLQPDWIWIKSRTGLQWHHLFDSSRGGDYRLHSNSINAESTLTNSKITSFNTDGFSTTDGENVNSTGNNYVAWQWKANAGSTSSNTDGTKTTTVQASTTSGFSIVTYNGLTNGQTIGHGLGGTPEMIIFKRRDAAGSWLVWHQGLGDGNNYLLLNSAAAKQNDSYEYISNIGSSTVQLQGSSSFNQDTVGYFFRGIEGYSKFGSYTGNNSSDAPFIYLGFKPSFFIVKDTNSANAWVMLDNKRDSVNAVNLCLLPYSSDAESNQLDQADFLSNGIKLRANNTQALQSNISGNKYIYMAFAESPFVTSTGIPVTAR